MRYDIADTGATLKLFLSDEDPQLGVETLRLAVDAEHANGIGAVVRRICYV